MKIKGFTKLSLQICALSVSMILLSFITDTDFWIEHFNYPHYKYKNPSCGIDIDDIKLHYHWNYRGWVYFITGFVYFILSVFKIAISHKEEDFK